MLYFRRTLAITAVLIVSIEAAADLVYESDFQSGVTTHWSSSDLSTDELGKVVLGLFKQETISLTLPAQPTGEYGITFDFFNFNTCDGAEGDSFEFQTNGMTFIDASFDNFTSFPDLQTYSAATPLGGGPFPTGTDNTGTDLLRHTGTNGTLIGNLRYTPSFIFTHNGGDMTFLFIGKINQPTVNFNGFPDEPWALDRVSVTTIPEPSMIPILSLLGLVGAAVRWRQTPGSIRRRREGGQELRARSSCR
ncbi:MAG: hypothetical protein ACE1ZA_05715 [Pseudomonadales bacterium]